VGKALHKIAWWAALVGGAIALAVGSMTVFSIAKRAITSKPLQGDVELVQLGIALSISLCIAWCQVRGGNIIVDFFTQKAKASINRFLDGLGALMLSVMYGLLSVRTLYGALAVYSSNETTPTLDLPGWWTYACLAPGLALAAVIALYQASLHFRHKDMSEITGRSDA
jgi:TRAP-type C4-dicarboxylate transport system permease small subunit